MLREGTPDDKIIIVSPFHRPMMSSPVRCKYNVYITWTKANSHHLYGTISEGIDETELSGVLSDNGMTLEIGLRGDAKVYGNGLDSIRLASLVFPNEITFTFKDL